MFKFINNSTNKVTEEKQPIKETLINHKINIDFIDLVSSDIINNDKIKEKEDTYDDIDVDKIC